MNIGISILDLLQIFRHFPQFLPAHVLEGRYHTQNLKVKSKKIETIRQKQPNNQQKNKYSPTDREEANMETLRNTLPSPLLPLEVPAGELKAEEGVQL